MEDEESTEKPSRKDRWKGAIQRTKTKLKEQGKKSDKDEFKLNDDVNDFLHAGRPSTSDSSTSRLEPPPDKLLFPQVDNDRMIQAGLMNAPDVEHRNITPPRSVNPAQRSPRGIPVPRIDVSRSQRWPAQQELRDFRAHETDDFLRPAQRPDQYARSQSQGPMPGRRKGNRSRNLSVTFLETPPVIIGEGGDEAEAPTIEIGRTKARARSVSPMPRRAMDGNPRQPRRTQVSTNAGFAAPGSRNIPQAFEPRRLARVQTGVIPTSAAGKSSADIEFEMTLQAPTPVTAARGPPLQRSPEHEAPPVTPNRLPPPMDGPLELGEAQPAQTNVRKRQLRPAMGKEDLRMQFEEGQALRHSRYRGLSNSSMIETEVSPVSPDLRQLSLAENDEKYGVVSERRVSEVSPISSDEPPGGWI